MSGKKYIILLTVLFFIFSGCQESFAGEDLAARITVSTLGIEESYFSGEPVKVSFEVYNYGDQEEDINISMADWDYDKEGINKIYQAGKLEDYSLKDFLLISPASFTLGPGEHKKINCDILIPADKTGPKWGLVLVETASKFTQEVYGGENLSSRFYASKTFGVKIRLLDRNNNSNLAKISHMEFIAAENKIINYIENNGKGFLTAYGEIRIINEDGKIVERIKIDRFKLLPGYKRKVLTEIPPGLSSGNYLAVTILDLGLENLLGSQVGFVLP